MLRAHLATGNGVDGIGFFKAVEDANYSMILLCLLARIFKELAGTTGLEPATSDVTGRRSNQLNYVPACR